MLGAGRVIAIDRVPERLRMAEKDGKAETINFEDEGVYDRLMVPSLTRLRWDISLTWAWKSASLPNLFQALKGRMKQIAKNW